MLNELFLVFTYLTEAMIVYIYAKNIYETRYSKSLTLILASVIYLIPLLIYQYVINTELINLIVILAVNIAIIKLLFTSSLKSAIFHSIALVVIQTIAEVISVYLISLFLHITSAETINNHFESGVIISRIIYFLFSVLLSNFSSRESNHKNWGKWFVLSLLPIGSAYSILVFKTLIENIDMDFKQNILNISALCVLLLVNIIIYFVYERAESDNQKLVEYELINQKNTIDMQYLSLLEKKSEQMQILTHDYKNHIQTIAAMSTSPDVKSYLNGILGEIEENNSIAKTKNKILDIILNKYVEICNDKGISFSTETISENLSFMDGNDLSAMFNNMLDNAVESAEISQGKTISLQISSSMNSYCKIVLINSCDHEPNEKDGKLLSTKKRPNFHGYGTKSIMKIVNKYSGDLQWYYNKKAFEFKLIIAIPIP
jgi:sensor histidine kinase YesM